MANGLGNVTNRIVTLVYRYRGGLVPSAEVDPLEAVLNLERTVNAYLADFDLRNAAQAIIDAVGALNRELEVTRPWQLGRNEGSDYQSRAQLDTLLAQLIRSARLLVPAVEALIPGISKRLQEQLGRTDRLHEPEPVFARIEAD